jgi:hypothetical protein
MNANDYTSMWNGIQASISDQAALAGSPSFGFQPLSASAVEYFSLLSAGVDRDACT